MSGSSSTSSYHRALESVPLCCRRDAPLSHDALLSVIIPYMSDRFRASDSRGVFGLERELTSWIKLIAVHDSVLGVGGGEEHQQRLATAPGFPHQLGTAQLRQASSRR